MSVHKHTHLPLLADRRCLAALAIALLCVLAQAFLYQPTMDAVFDIAIYKGIGERVVGLLHGAAGNVDSEYPPLATLLFLLTAATRLPMSFGTTWLLLMLLYISAATAYAVFVLRDRHAWLVPACIALTVFVTGPEMMFGRYDAVVALLLLLTLRARANERFVHSAAFLALAIGVKVVPILVVPALFATAPRRAWRSMVLGLCIGATLSFAIPALIMGPGLAVQNSLHMLSYHSGREVQLESLWSGAYAGAKAMFGQRSPVGMGHLSVINTDLGPEWLTVSKILILSSVALLTVLAWVRRRADADTMIAGVLALAVALSPVFSPQYVVWIVPLLFAWVAVRWMSHQRAPVLQVGLLAAVIGFSTQWIFPLHYSSVIDQEPMALLVLNVRNAAVFVAALVLLGHAIWPHRFARRVSVRHALIRLGADASLLLLALVAMRMLATTHALGLPTVHYEQDALLHGAAPGSPFSMDAPAGEMPVRASLFIPDTVSDGRFYLKADDCFTAFAVNGVEVPEAAFCDDGRNVDLSAYVQPGRNTIAATIKNIVGPTGFTMLPATMTPLLWAIAGAVFALAWFTAQGLLSVIVAYAGACSGAHHPAGVSGDIRERVRAVLQVSLLEMSVA